MDVIFVPLFNVLKLLVGLYIWAVIGHVILNWLVAFGIVNNNNQIVSMINDFLFNLVEPALKPIRNFIPNFGGFDLSPLALILALYFVETMITRLAMKFGL